MRLSAMKESIVVILRFLLWIFLTQFSQLINFAEAYSNLREWFISLILKLTDKRLFSRLRWKLNMRLMRMKAIINRYVGENS
jgi:hypothetical protein